MINRHPTGCLGIATPSGWMNTETFVQWMKDFIQHVKHSLEHPVLLPLDNNQESHVSIKRLD
jgi:hypothetical protein